MLERLRAETRYALVDRGGAARAANALAALLTERKGRRGGAIHPHQEKPDAIHST